MKLYSNDLNRLLKIIADKQAGSILLHGPNYGFTRLIVEQLISKFNLMARSLSAKEVNLPALESMAMARNFLGQRELIKITNTSNSTIDKAIRDFLINQQFDNLICFIADEPLPSFGIRKFFEEQKNLVAVGCYYDNEQTVGRIFLEQCGKSNKSVEDEALAYLKQHLKGDYQIIHSEIDKILAYVHDKNHITREDVEKTLSSGIISSGDEMCVYFAKKQPLNWLEEVNRLIGQNINQVLIIRALIRYYINLYIVCSKIEDNDNIDNAIKSLSQPIFFKYVNDFKQICRSVSSADIIRVLSVLQNAEMSYKDNPAAFDFMNQVYLPSYALS